MRFTCMIKSRRSANFALGNRILTTLVTWCNESLILQGDHVYTVKKREGSSPGPTIHEIHPSEISDNVQIVETPVSEDSNSPIM